MVKTLRAYLLTFALLGCLAVDAGAATDLIKSSVANLPTSGPAGMSRIVTDGADGGDCTSGAGTFAVLCTFDGTSTWTAGGGGVGAAPAAATYITQTANGTLSGEQALGALATGCLSSTTTTGVVAARTITGTANKVTVTNGDCSGNPTLTIPDAVTLVSPAITTSLLIPNDTAVPGTCTIGMLFFDNNASAGVNLYGCTASNTWTLLGDGSGSGAIATDTIWDAAGDLVYGTGSNTASRLAAGTGLQVLQMNAGATAPEWTSDPTFDSVTVAGAATGSVQVNGVTSGSFKITTADATGQAITLTGAAQTSGATILTVPDMAGTNDTLLFAAKAATLTNKTLNCSSGTGNVCTIWERRGGDLVGLADASTVGHIWDFDPLSTTCAPLAVTGTNQSYGVCTFADSDGEYGRQIEFDVPTGGIASMNADIWWKTTGTGNARFQIQTLCYASDAAGDSAYSNSTYVTAAAGTSARLVRVNMPSITITGCDANERMAIRFSRNRTEASDSLDAALDVRRVLFNIEVAQ